MMKDGTIVLDLRAEGSGGTFGEGHFIYPPGHYDYCEIFEHLRGLEPGEHKLVQPWPDSKR
jgi:hypothetical protein